MLVSVDVLLPVLPPDEAVHRRAAGHLPGRLRAARPVKLNGEAILIIIVLLFQLPASK